MNTGADRLSVECVSLAEEPLVKAPVPTYLTCGEADGV